MNCPKHVEFHDKINVKLVHLVSFIKRLFFFKILLALARFSFLQSSSHILLNTNLPKLDLQIKI